MRIPRFFAQRSDLQNLEQLELASCTGETIELSEDDLIKQLLSVLRLGKRDRLLLLDRSQNLYELEIETVKKTSVICRIDSAWHAPEKSIPVQLGLSLIKQDRFEWCIEKLTELGVAQIYPLISKHCVVRLTQKDEDRAFDKRRQSKMKRWQAIAREAAEQCERTTIPPVVEPMQLLEFLSGPENGGKKNLRYICAERYELTPLVKALTNEISNRSKDDMGSISSIQLAIGPEGGFAAEEMSEAIAAGWQQVSLAKRILRSETAAIAAMSQVASILDI